MKPSSRLVVVASVASLATVSLASGAGPAGGPTPAPTAAPNAACLLAQDPNNYDLSGKALTCNPALLAQIDTTLIAGAGCRTMDALGYGNGYQCPSPAGVSACTTMMMAGQVDACAAFTPRYPPNATAPGCKLTAQQGAVTTCPDFSPDLWSSLAVRIPLPSVVKRLSTFGCTATGKTVFCPASLVAWACMPFQRGGVVTCQPSPVPPPPPPPPPPSPPK